MQMPDGTHLAYYVAHESYWSQGSFRFNEGRPTIMVTASAKGSGGGVRWEFGIADHSHDGSPVLRMNLYDEAWPAIAQVPELFTALAAGKATTLTDVRSLLDALGAVDETERTER